MELDSAFDELDGHKIVWQTDLQSLDEVVSDLSFFPTQPIYARVVEGFMLNVDQCLDGGQILKLLCRKKQLVELEATDINGRKIELPLDCQTKVKVVPCSEKKYRTVREICAAPCWPKYIENKRWFQFHGMTFAVGTTFEIMSCSDSGLSVICHAQHKFHLSLVKSVRGDFQETQTPDDKDKEYLLEDIAGRAFPIWVEFLDRALQIDEKTVYEEVSENLQEREKVCIEKLRAVETVCAVNYVRGETFTVMFPRHLDVRLQLGVVVEKDATEEEEYVSMLDPRIIEKKNIEINHNKIPKLKSTEATDTHIYEVPTFNKLKDNVKRAVPNKYEPNLSSSCFDCNNNERGTRHSSIPVPSANDNMSKVGDKQIDAISNILHRLQLGVFVEKFRENQIDLKLLNNISESSLVSDLEMTRFQARKLLMYIRGWRPDDESLPTVADQPITDENEGRMEIPEKWNEDEVCSRMQGIKLSVFAEFCSKNQVNGKLLTSIVDKGALEGLREDHGVSLKGIEESKLYSYVKDGWRPTK